MIKLFAVLGMIAAVWWIGYQHGHHQVAAECERLGGFFVGKKIYKCHAIEDKPEDGDDA